MKKKHDELEERMKELEAKNKAYAEKHSHLVNECCRATERNTVLSKLINCLTSMLAIQGERARELPSSDASRVTSIAVSTKGESMKAARKLLLDSLKALKFNTPELIMKSGQMQPSMRSTRLPIEEAKAPDKAEVSPYEMQNNFPCSGNLNGRLEPQGYYGGKEASDEKGRLDNNII